MAMPKRDFLCCSATYPLAGDILQCRMGFVVCAQRRRIRKGARRIVPNRLFFKVFLRETPTCCHAVSVSAQEGQLDVLLMKLTAQS
jgi:hypothetical protein